MKPVIFIAVGLLILSCAREKTYDRPKTGVVAGHVFSQSSGWGIAGARLQVIGEPLVLTSDADGYYLFPGVSEGSHQVRCDLDLTSDSLGSYHDTLTAEVAESETSRVNFTFQLVHE